MTCRTPAGPTARRLLPYLCGLFADLTGDQAWFVALAWSASQAGGDARAGVIVALGTAPRLVALLPAGGLVDRVGALRAAQGAQAARIVVMCAALGVGMRSPHDPVLLGALAMMFGLADALRLPAAGALLPAIVSPESLTRSQGLVSAVNRAAVVAAGPAAGLALAAGGLRAVAAVNVLLFGLAMTLFGFLRRHAPSGPRVGTPGHHHIAEGLRSVLRHPRLLAMLLTATALNLALSGPLDLGLVLRVEHEGWSPRTLGALLAVFGAAATLGALSLWVYQPRCHRALAGYLWSALAGAGLAVAGSAPTLRATAIGLGVSGFALGPAGALLLGTVQSETAPELMGRMMGLVTLASVGVTPVGLVGFGLLAGATSATTAFVVSSGLVMAISVGCACAPRLRAPMLPGDEP